MSRCVVLKPEGAHRIKWGKKICVIVENGSHQVGVKCTSLIVGGQFTEIIIPPYMYRLHER